MEGGEGTRRPHRVTGRKGPMPRPMQKTPDKSSDAGKVPRSGRRGKSAAERRENKLFHDRSRDVYENKEKDDNLSVEKGETYTKLNDILYKSPRFLLKPPDFLSRLERLRTNPALQNVETPGHGCNRWKAGRTDVRPLRGRILCRSLSVGFAHGS